MSTFIKAPASKAMAKGERERLLAVLADRFLAEASALGFTGDRPTRQRYERGKKSMSLEPGNKTVEEEW